MTTIHIDLQEGFENHEVSLIVDGVMIFNQMKVSTRLQIGLAESVHYDTDRADVVIEINIMPNDVRAMIRLEVDKTPYLGISLEEKDNIRAKRSNEPFGYL